MVCLFIGIYCFPLLGRSLKYLKTHCTLPVENKRAGRHSLQLPGESDPALEARGCSGGGGDQKRSNYWTCICKWKKKNYILLKAILLSNIELVLLSSTHVSAYSSAHCPALAILHSLY